MTSPRTLLTASGQRAKKYLGQHFLVDMNIAKKIVKATDANRDDIILEIGAGLGALTVHGAKIAETVFAVEKDPQTASMLKNELKIANADNVELIIQDIMSLDICGVAPATQLKIMGSLPYNISSQIIVALIKSRTCIESAVLMLQKELADRLYSPPGTKAYSRLAAMLQYCSDVEKVVEVPASCFFPRPKIDSSVIKVIFKEKIHVEDEDFYFGIIKAAFSSRRKNLKNSLSKSWLEISSVDATQSLKNAGIDPLRRAETLSPQEFADLAASIHAILNR